MRTRKESCTLAKMLSLLPAPKRYFTPISTVKKGTCKRRISASFLGTRTIFIRAVPEFFCRVNRPKMTDVCHALKFTLNKEGRSKTNSCSVFIGQKAVNNMELKRNDALETKKWSRFNIQKIRKQRSCANEHKVPFILPSIYCNKTANCSSGGYQMFVKFICFVRLGFILTHYSSEKNYASVLCNV